mmetsp:Transcript_9426/g.27252  ORF Transcript_9426/g.27252 Transcript_9426/m.27252 type:complete len:421 (+) Transcript_9426:2-1264(+)
MRRGSGIAGSAGAPPDGEPEDGEDGEVSGEGRIAEGPVEDAPLPLLRLHLLHLRCRDAGPAQRFPLLPRGVRRADAVGRWLLPRGLHSRRWGLLRCAPQQPRLVALGALRRQGARRAHRNADEGRHPDRSPGAEHRHPLVCGAGGGFPRPPPDPPGGVGLPGGLQRRAVGGVARGHVTGRCPHGLSAVGQRGLRRGDRAVPACSERDGRGPLPGQRGPPGRRLRGVGRGRECQPHCRLRGDVPDPEDAPHRLYPHVGHLRGARCARCRRERVRVAGDDATARERGARCSPAAVGVPRHSSEAAGRFQCRPRGSLSAGLRRHLFCGDDVGDGLPLVALPLPGHCLAVRQREGVDLRYGPPGPRHDRLRGGVPPHPPLRCQRAPLRGPPRRCRRLGRHGWRRGGRRPREGGHVLDRCGRGGV